MKEEKKDLQLVQDINPDGIYCQQCGTCIDQCSKALDIPTLMRSYMYAYGYKNLAHAQACLNDVDLSDNPCTHCETCEVRCIMGSDVKNKIMDIVRLKNIPEEFCI